MHMRANRMMFGQVQEEYGNTMKTLGLATQDGSGVLRANVRDEKGFKSTDFVYFYPLGSLLYS